MEDRFFKNILFGVAAGLSIAAPVARGAVSLEPATVLLLAMALLVFLGRRRLGTSSGLDAVIVGWVALAAISCCFSVYQHDSISALARILVFTGFYYLVLGGFDAGMRDRFLGVVVVFGTLLSGFGLLQAGGMFDHSWWYPGEFLAATFVNHNHFAGYLEMVIPVALALMAGCAAGRLYRRLALGAGIVIMSAAFVLTQSRAAWVSLAIALLVMGPALFKKWVRGRRDYVLLVVIVVVLGVFSTKQRGVIFERVGTLAALTQEEKGPSFENRLMIWDAAVRMVRHRPLTGVGVGAFDAGFYRYRPAGLSDQRVVYAHNDYLHMAAEMGVLAPFLMLGILLIILKAGFRRDNDAGVIGCTAGVLSLSLHGFADFNFHIPANMLLLTIYAGLIMSGAPGTKRMTHVE